MAGTTETQLILSAIERQGNDLTKRMDSQQKDIVELKGVVTQLARIEERQLSFDSINKDNIRRVHERIDKTEAHIDLLQTELSENRWLFKLGNSVVTKIILGALVVGVAAYNMASALNH